MNPHAISLPWPTLTGNRVELLPMVATHQEALTQAASDGALWNLKVTLIPRPPQVKEYIAAALADRAAGTALPFVIALKDTGRIVGSTRYLKIDQRNRSLEIGYTWIAASFQRSFVNTETKYLLLRYAFEDLKALRVQFVTDELNTRSRAALLRIGARQEGIIRRERIMPDGRQRNAALFSIIDSEWPSVRQLLGGKLAAMSPQASQ